MMQSRNLLWLLPLFLLGLIPLVWRPLGNFLTPRGGYDQAALDRAMQLGRAFLLDDIVINLASEGIPSWEIRSRQAQTESGNDRLINMVEVTAVHNNRNGEKVFIESRRGTYHMDTRLLTLLEDVVLKKPSKGEVLRTELLHYDDVSKKVDSPVAVDIVSPSYHITGGRMDYDITTDRYDLGKRVHARF
ncbi:MAG: LPS export ABC transporter periplasmic protein LptC [Desulfobulbaceae bacterium A2]|nr:MAG: LPS export ABC transporter periplasmic protein LptC [Desulfobulbaceae bacterium A2]